MISLSHRVTALCLFVLAFLPAAYFGPQIGGGWQVTTRLGLTLSMVQEHTLTIDSYARRTGDKAFYEGHYYADKAPGQSFLAIPVVAATQAVLQLQNAQTDGTSKKVFRTYTRFAVIFVTALVSALAASGIYFAAISLKADRRAAIVGSLAIAFGSPFFGYSTTFLQHAPAGALLVVFFTLLVRELLRATTARTRPSVGWAVVTGLVGAVTATVDFTMVPLMTAMGIVFLGFAFAAKAPNLLAYVGAVALSGLCGLIPLALYNGLAFGSPLHFGYGNVVGFKGMQTGFFGISLPNPYVALQLLFWPQHGMLPVSPILLFVPSGLWTLWRMRTARPAAIAILLAIVIALCINAGYYYWDGGKGLGPRHIVQVLPLCGIALAFGWPRRSPIWQGVFVGCLVVSVLFGVLGAAVTVFPDPKLANPIGEALLAQAVASIPKIVPCFPILAAAVWLAFFTKGRRRSSSVGVSPVPVRG